MTSSIQHGGVMRAAFSLEYAEPGEPGVVQFLTSGGRHPPLSIHTLPTSISRECHGPLNYSTSMTCFRNNSPVA